MSKVHRAVRIQPSVLAADLANLASEAASVLNAGADELHLDIMDGHFVPNITFGNPVISSLRKHFPDAFFDCHMMVSKPSQWVNDIAKAGGSRYTFHIEAIDSDDLDVAGVCKLIRDSGMEVGVALKPNTGADAVSSIITLVDMVLVMTVEPGFGGQAFMPGMMSKVLALHTAHPEMNIQVDGGLSPANIDVAAAAGANFIVAGSSVFKPGVDPRGPITTMRKSVLKLGNGLTDEEVEAEISKVSAAVEERAQKAQKVAA